MYVHIDGPFSYHAWWENLKAGRVFVTNGPLLRAKANGRFPGYVFRSRGPLKIKFEISLTSQDPTLTVELVKNGKVRKLPFPPIVTFEESGWFLLRVLTPLKKTFRFASTGPWYVLIDSDELPVRREAASFFLNWTRLWKKRLSEKVKNHPKKEALLKPVKEAEIFWQKRLESAAALTQVQGEIVDADTGNLIPARLYIKRKDGRFFFARSASARGKAIPYKRRNWINPKSFEFHTTLSADPFVAKLKPGIYTFTAERGIEYRPASCTVSIGGKPVKIRLSLKRWVNMAKRDWFSADLHVHRSPNELPNVMLAEDLNLAFPLINWVTRAGVPAANGDKNTERLSGPNLVQIDKNHAFWQQSSEYEIFTVGSKRHTLGAVLLLGHTYPLKRGVPPVGPVAEEVHKQGGIIDLEKHDWPWSMALVPVANVDLYELANNHNWRTQFAMTRFTTAPPRFMGIRLKEGKGDEKAWTFYTFKNYYVLLNCGFRLMPSAGTANGVHPVPLGFNRVYVNLPKGFNWKAYIKALKSGPSFITNGPMLISHVEKEAVRGTVLSMEPVKEKL